MEQLYKWNRACDVKSLLVPLIRTRIFLCVTGSIIANSRNRFTRLRNTLDQAVANIPPMGLP